MKRYQPKRGFKITLAILGFSILFIPLLGPYVLFGVALAGICFFTFGGFEKISVHPFEDSRRYKECFLGEMYNVEDRLRKEMENIEKYREEQANAWEYAKTGLLILGAGILITVVSIIAAFFMPPLVLGAVPGYFIMFMSYRWFWDSFINSSLPLAAKISDLFMIRSTSTKITESSKMINALRRRLEQERAKEEKLYGKVLE